MGKEHSRRALSSPEGFHWTVSTASTGTTLTNGKAWEIVGSSDTPAYLLEPPVAGTGMWIYCTLATSSQQANVRFNSTLGSFHSSNSTAITLRELQFLDGNDSVYLMGRSTSQYHIAINTGGVTVSAT